MQYKSRQNQALSKGSALLFRFSHGRYHQQSIIYTYIRIFDKQIKTPTYTSPTWGGLPYAMPKIRTALRASENRTEKVKEQDLCEEVY